MEPVIQGPVDPSSVSMASLNYKKQPFKTTAVFFFYKITEDSIHHTGDS